MCETVDHHVTFKPLHIQHDATHERHTFHERDGPCLRLSSLDLLDPTMLGQHMAASLDDPLRCIHLAPITRLLEAEGV